MQASRFSTKTRTPPEWYRPSNQPHTYQPPSHHSNWQAVTETDLNFAYNQRTSLQEWDVITGYGTRNHHQASTPEADQPSRYDYSSNPAISLLRKDSAAGLGHLSPRGPAVQNHPPPAATRPVSSYEEIYMARAPANNYSTGQSSPEVKYQSQGFVDSDSKQVSDRTRTDSLYERGLCRPLSSISGVTASPLNSCRSVRYPRGKGPTSEDSAPEGANL